MKIIVIGSKGFIGSHCFSYYHTRHEVWGCDVFTDYNEKKFFLIDTFSPSYHSLFQDIQFDVCINCAGAASVPESIKNPLRDFELNALLVFKLLDSIRQLNPNCKFINISSAAIYGNPVSLPVNEQQSPNPISPYGIHKFFAENICKEFATHFSLKTCSVRIFSAYGPGLKKQIFWDLFIKSKQGDRIELFGTGDETRDYIFISDIVKAIDCIINNADFIGESYNLGFGAQHSLRVISTLFLKLLNWNGSLSFTGTKKNGDPDYWQADIHQIQKLGFNPSISIEEGITEYAKWIKDLQ